MLEGKDPLVLYTDDTGLMEWTTLIGWEYYMKRETEREAGLYIRTFVCHVDSLTDAINLRNMHNRQFELENNHDE